MNTNRNGFRMGLILGASLGLGGLALIGMASQSGVESLQITQSTDGRTAYLWRVETGGIEFIDSATATGGVAPNMDQIRPDTPANAQEAQSMLDRATQYIKDGKLDQAEQLLTKLEGMDGLSSSMQSKIKSARQLLDAANLGQGMPSKLPTVPGFPK